MKTTDPRDPLDRSLDDLLRSQPLRPQDDFVARTLEAAATEPARRAPSLRARFVRIALPAAAAIALAFVLVTYWRDAAPNATPQQARFEATGLPDTESLSSAELQEIFLLQEGLAGLASLPADPSSSQQLLDTLDSLYLDERS